jgi:rubrerythrin
MNTLEYAINMEHDGEKYYTEQAEINKDNSLYVVCTMLAEDEKKHAQILEKKRREVTYELTDSDTLMKTKNIFKDATNIKVLGKEKVTQLDFYRIASDMEKDSIVLYEQFLEKATDAKEKELFEYLIQQEKYHFELFEELSFLLNRPEEWVESAEFGTREEY